MAYWAATKAAQRREKGREWKERMDKGGSGAAADKRGYKAEKFLGWEAVILWLPGHPKNKLAAELVTK